ncbi:MAG: MBL fold metallo-hydrolase [Candidatus Peregrinibacteria bacterium]
MEIKWHGKTCFEVKDRDRVVVINPPKGIKISGTVVLKSNPGESGEVQGAVKIFDLPGEYEIKDIPIMGFNAWTKARSKEEKEGKGASTVIFYFEIGDVKFCHLGDLGHALMDDTVKEIEDVDVLMMNMGSDSNLDSKKTMEVIESLEPRVVIPMGEGDFKSALKDLGADKIEPVNSYVIKSRSELPEDKRLYVLLNKTP